ncbi:MAG: hypothetical protein LUG24_07235 [Clostridiales bacterium]|nr:hypothetical protein [Clostridiales bacterium]
MELYNEIAKAIEDDPALKKYDEHVKRLLGIKIFLAHILIGCIDEFKELDPYEVAEKYIEGDPQISKVPVNRNEAYMQTITGMNTEDSSIDEKTVVYDILFYAYLPISGETVKFIINVEAQLKFNPGYSLLKRAVYYCSRMISAQYTKEFDEKTTTI